MLDDLLELSSSKITTRRCRSPRRRGRRARAATRSCRRCPCGDGSARKLKLSEPPSRVHLHRSATMRSPRNSSAARSCARPAAVSRSPVDRTRASALRASPLLAREPSAGRRSPTSEPSRFARRAAPQHQRRLTVAARGVDEVLPGRSGSSDSSSRSSLSRSVNAVPERQGAEAERVDPRLCHYIMLNIIKDGGVRSGSAGSSRVGGKTWPLSR